MVTAEIQHRPPQPGGAFDCLHPNDPFFAMYRTSARILAVIGGVGISDSIGAYAEEGRLTCATITEFLVNTALVTGFIVLSRLKRIPRSEPEDFWKQAPTQESVID